MLYIYRRRNSVGARDLSEGIMLQGTLARRTKGGALRNLQPNDVVVCWGDNFAVPAGIKTLNNVPPINKFAEAQKLAEKGVATIQVSRTQPANIPARPSVRPPFTSDRYRGLAHFEEPIARQLLTDLTNYLAAPLPPAIPAETWLARNNNHVGGADLLSGAVQGDYYSKKENIVEEYRLHMFRGKSIRAGKKEAKLTRPDGRTPAHQWIRSFDAGWIINYTGFESTAAMRKLASSALKALDLEFGAVDMGKKADGTLIVLEVNRAPGVEGGTVEAYARNIIKWAGNPDAVAEAE